MNLRLAFLLVLVLFVQYRCKGFPVETLDKDE